MSSLAASEVPFGLPFEVSPTGACLEAGSVYAFVLAGNARFTIVSKKTGKRFTFRVRSSKEENSPWGDRWFVSLLTGPDNGSDYEYLGCIVADRRSLRGRWEHGKKSRVDASAPGAKAFAWFWGRVEASRSLDECEVWHLGKCGKCARDLSVPESIASGFGPECRKGAC